jgi:mannose-1-phosphate guanylyltransferase
MLVLPSDQMLHEVEDLKVSLKLSLAEVARGQIVTFGITSTYPTTAYGYLETPKPVKHGPIQPIRFIEKPDTARAQKMIKSGSFLWNAGMILFKAKDILTAFKTHAPALVRQVNKAIKASKDDRRFYRLGAEEWSSVENISMVRLACGWSDLGSWDAI